MFLITIDNSKNAAVQTKNWKDPGAELYKQLLSSTSSNIPASTKDLEKQIKEKTYIGWTHFLQEAYLTAPVKNIKNSPHGVTPYNSSGCKYPHHVIVKDDPKNKNKVKLVIHIEGLKAAYKAAFRASDLKGDVKTHMERHLKDLGITVQFHHGEIYFEDTTIYQNFEDIEAFIENTLSIDLKHRKVTLGDMSWMMEKDCTITMLPDELAEVVRKLNKKIISTLIKNIHDKYESKHVDPLLEDSAIEELKKHLSGKGMGNLRLIKKSNSCSGRLTIAGTKLDWNFAKRRPGPIVIGRQLFEMLKKVESDLKNEINDKYKDIGKFRLTGDSSKHGMHHFEFKLTNDKATELWDGIFKTSNNKFNESTVEGDPIDDSDWSILMEYVDDELDWIEAFLMEGEETVEPSDHQTVATQIEPEKKSIPKQTDEKESDKNGVRRKKLYIAFIEWCKAYNPKNTFGSVFDSGAFRITYPFVPEEMRYFYRLANPLVCVLSGDLTFFPVSDLRKINVNNSRLNQLLIFAATPQNLRVFNVQDKKIYLANEQNNSIVLENVLGETFDLYIQKMIDQGDILHAPLEESMFKLNDISHDVDYILYIEEYV